MSHDYDRRSRVAADRIWIEKGKLVQLKNVVLMADVLMVYSDCEIHEALEYQLYDEKGAPVHQTYRGVGQVVSHGSHNVLILGDPQRDATLNEYRIDKNPTPESDKRLDAMIAGVHAALGDFKPGRRQTSKGQDWLAGYDEAMKYRKRVTKK